MNLASTNRVDQRWTQSGSRTDGEMEAFPYDPPGNVDIGESSWDAVGCRRRHQVCASGAGRDLTAPKVREFQDALRDEGRRIRCTRGIALGRRHSPVFNMAEACRNLGIVRRVKIA